MNFPLEPREITGPAFNPSLGPESGLGGKPTLGLIVSGHVVELFRKTVGAPGHRLGPLGPREANGSDGGWRRSNAADEYDRYLLRVVGRLQSGQTNEALVDYLVGIETMHMRLAATSTARSRAEATVAALREQVERFN